MFEKFKKIKMIHCKSYRLAVRNYFSVEFVHGHEGRSVRFKLDEGICRLLAGELVTDVLWKQKLISSHFNVQNQILDVL